MDHTVRLAMTATFCAWIAVAVLLQFRQLHRSKRTERSEWGSLLGFVILVALGVEVATPLERAVPELSYGASAWADAAVLILAWAGIALRLWAIVTLGRFFRGTVHIQHHHTVVQSGPYRWVRHPAYSGILLAGAALAATFDNAASWAVCVTCFVLAVACRISIEERMLVDALGEAYTSYAARTRRLIPGVW